MVSYIARYINADNFISQLKDELESCKVPFGNRSNGKSITFGIAIGLRRAISLAETLSTEDILPKGDNTVEVIRCKDCEYWEKDSITKHAYSSEDRTLVNYAECEKWSSFFTCYKTKFDDYCSEAVKDISNTEGGEGVGHDYKN